MLQGATTQQAAVSVTSAVKEVRNNSRSKWDLTSKPTCLLCLAFIPTIKRCQQPKQLGLWIATLQLWWSNPHFTKFHHLHPTSFIWKTFYFPTSTQLLKHQTVPKLFDTHAWKVAILHAIIEEQWLPIHLPQQQALAVSEAHQDIWHPRSCHLRMTLRDKTSCQRSVWWKCRTKKIIQKQRRITWSTKNKGLVRLDNQCIQHIYRTVLKLKFQNLFLESQIKCIFEKDTRYPKPSPFSSFFLALGMLETLHRNHQEKWRNAMNTRQFMMNA